MRARWAILLSGLIVEWREVDLKNKSGDLLKASSKGTVPVLVKSNGEVLDESLGIVKWCLERSDPINIYKNSEKSICLEIDRLIKENDTKFKYHLDRYKYSARFADSNKDFHKTEARKILLDWTSKIEKNSSTEKRWLVGKSQSVADISIWPFVRQFRATDTISFDQDNELKPLRNWLNYYLENPLFKKLMKKTNIWDPKNRAITFPECSYLPQEDQFIYHLALNENWEQALKSGEYIYSTLDILLEEVGFIHGCFENQLHSTYDLFFRNRKDILSLKLTRSKLSVPIRVEKVDSGDFFPHIYGPIPIESVIEVSSYSN